MTDTVKIIKREEWGALSPRRRFYASWGSIDYIRMHQLGHFDERPTDRDRVARIISELQKAELRRYNDIRFNLAVDLEGRVWELRGVDVMDGWDETTGRAKSILLIKGAKQPVTDAMRRAVDAVCTLFEQAKGVPLERDDLDQFDIKVEVSETQESAPSDENTTPKTTPRKAKPRQPKN